MSKNPKPPLSGEVARVSGSEVWEVKVWKMSRITDISKHPSFHPSVAYGDSSRRGEP